MKMSKIGVQLFTIREYMKTAEDIRMSFRRVKELGYDQVQTAGCEIPYEQFGRIACEEGLEVVGTHDSFQKMCDDFDASYADHQLLGTKLMGIGGFACKSIEEVNMFIAKANVIASKIGKKGGRFTYHNHSREFSRDEEGKLVMERLLEGLNAKYTSFVLDTYWVQHGGGDVRYWIERLADRIDILHLKDMAMNHEMQYMTEIGNGNLYWEGILESAVKANVAYYVVEQDVCPGNPFDSLKQSSDFLHKHFM